MVKAIVSVLLIFTLFSCNVETRYLENNKTKVPTDNQVFGNRSLFDSKTVEAIDTEAVYEEIYSYLSQKDNFISNGKQKNYNTQAQASYYRFYANGAVNFFILQKDFDAVREQKNIDPNYNGSRGILYQKEDKLKIDLFTIKSYGLKPNYGLVTHLIEIKGDTLFEKSIKDPSSVRVYAKRKLTPMASAYRADW